jgi:uncharacterized damage-inducible protein DinB
VNELELVQEWYRYNAAVRDVYLDTLLSMPKKDRLRDRGASFPSLQEVFVHVLDAYRWWFFHVATDDAGSYRDLPAREMTPNQIRGAVHDVNKLVFGYLRQLSDRDLSQFLTAKYVEDGKKGQIKIRVRDMVWHMVEEELQHRGELNALLWQIDVDPPISPKGIPVRRKRKSSKAGRKHRRA